MVKAVSALKWRFLAVFWLYKMADWLQGPYFYDVYASKIINGVQVNSEGVARLFLMGFGSTAVFGAAIGGLVDSAGRKRGSLAFALMYTLSALSTRASTLPLLLGGRLVGGIGTSLLFSVRRRAARFCRAIRRAIRRRAILRRPLSTTHRHRRRGSSPSTRGALPPAALSQIFGLAYFGDSLVAIGAGQLAGAVASKRGPVAPFELSTLFLAAGAAIVAATWGENFGVGEEGGEGGREGGGQRRGRAGRRGDRRDEEGQEDPAGGGGAGDGLPLAATTVSSITTTAIATATSPPAPPPPCRRSSRAQCTSSCFSGRRR